MTTDTPIYDQLHAESDWTPDMLRPGYDLDAAISQSYQRLGTRALQRYFVQLLVALRARRAQRGQLP